jgi:ABC-type lipoprotein release transport system permease subunit
MNIIEMAMKNIRKSKFKAIIMILLLSLGMGCFLIVIDAGSAVKSSLENEILKFKNLTEIDVYSKISGNSISESQLVKLEKIDHIKMVIKQYKIHVLLTEKGDNPITDGTLYNFDYKRNILPTGEDFRSSNEDGMILPDLEVNVNESKVLSNYVGKEIYVKFDSIDKNNEIVEKTFPMKVIGVYNASQPIQANPIYISESSMLKFLKERSSSAEDILNINTLMVYVDNAENIQQVSSKIEDLGLKTKYALKDFNNAYLTFNSLLKVVLSASMIILFLALTIMVQLLNNNIKSREREIGVLKAFGYTNVKIALILAVEALILMILPIIFSLLLYRVVGQKGAEVFSNFGQTMVIGISQVVKVITLTIILILLALINPIRKCCLLNPIDVLKGE